jgi:hypothetical protein
MLLLLLHSVHPQFLPARTAIVFAGELISLPTSSGPRIVYGAYLPSPGFVNLSSPVPNASLIFPNYCSAIGLSNEPSFSFELPLSSGIPEFPYVNICIWLHSQPANISYAYRGVTNNTLQLEQIDGFSVPPVILTPGDRFEIQHDVLLRWLILSPEDSSFFLPSLRIDPSSDYVPEKTFSTFFVVGNETVYFDAPPLSDTPVATESPLATATPEQTITVSGTAKRRTATRTKVPTKSSGPMNAEASAAPIVVIVLSIAGLLVLIVAGFCCYRRYMARKGGRPSRLEEIPEDDTGDDGSNLPVGLL